jgi:uncharacterized membrane protein YfcA
MSKSVFRVTVSTTLLALNVIRLVGYFATGFIRTEDALLIAAAAVPVIAGTLLGDRLHDRMDPQTFRRGVGGLLILSGLGLLLLRA